MLIGTAYPHSFFLQFLPSEREMATWKRVGNIALPFFSLYSPAEKAISLSKKSHLCITPLNQVIREGWGRSWLQRAKRIALVTFTSLSLIAFLVQSQMGLLAVGSVELLIKAVDMCRHLYAGEFIPAFEEGLSLLTGALSLALLVAASLEVILIRMLFKLISAVYHARKEFSQEKYPEALAIIMLSLIQFYQRRSFIEQGWKRVEEYTKSAVVQALLLLWRAKYA